MTTLTIALALLMAPIRSAQVTDHSAWVDAWYQYRVPISAHSSEAGWQQLPIDQAAITEAINAIDPFKYDPLYFAFNDLRIVEVDAEGRVIDDNVDAGFFLALEGKELAGTAMQCEDEFFHTRVVPHAFHLVSYTSSEGGRSPLNSYEAIFSRDSPLSRNNFKVSYFPPMLPLAPTQQEDLVVPDRPDMKLLMNGRFATKLQSISVKKADIRLCINVKNPGEHRWMIYYQPRGSHHLQLPDRRMDKLPSLAARVSAVGSAQKLVGNTQYRLSDDALLGVSFAASTVKITRHTPVPAAVRDGIDLQCAANEAESFQLLLSSKRPTSLIDVTASSLKGPNGELPSDAVSIKSIAYVPIRRSSFITPARYVGEIADALVPIKPGILEPRDGHAPLWLTVRVPAGTAPGQYVGSVTIRCDGTTVTLPLRVQVHAFELPKYSHLKTDMGGQFFVKRMRGNEPINQVTRYHGLDLTADNVRKLSHAYYDIMADNKFAPKSVAMYTEVGVKWTPPPKGYNVDEPGNVFQLSDWDFTELNKTLSHYIDEKGLNSFCILHTNPRTCNVFMHLPGEPLDEPNAAAPFVVNGNQAFRAPAFFACGEVIEGYRDQVTMITVAQWDDLVLKYFRGVAENLEAHGWLDKTHILIDEQEHAGRLEHFLRLLKSDPLTAQIQVVACVQSPMLINEMSEDDPSRRRFAGLIDTYLPEVDENYDRWMDYYFDDYNIPRDGRSLWMYVVYSSRHVIDTPGINNQILGLDLFRRGATGYLIWETFAWQHAYGDSENPWDDPHTRMGNGALALFYPPHREGLSPEPDWTLTPSLRLEAFRESVDDFDRATILKNLRDKASSRNIPTSEADEIFTDIHRLFRGNTNWTQNDVWYLDLRHRMADAIVNLKQQLD